MEAEQDLVEWSFSAASISRLDAALVWRRCGAEQRGDCARGKAGACKSERRWAQSERHGPARAQGRCLVRAHAEMDNKTERQHELYMDMMHGIRREKGERESTAYLGPHGKAGRLQEDLGRR
jgi:hypothetical protein